MSETIVLNLCKKCDDKHYWATKDGESISSKDLCKQCRKTCDKTLNDEFIGFMRSSLNDVQMDHLKDLLTNAKPSVEYPITIK